MGTMVSDYLLTAQSGRTAGRDFPFLPEPETCSISLSAPTDTLPQKGRRFVLGAGAGMEMPLLKLDSRWHVFGVRGPLTASFLGLSLELATTDPAMCIGTLWEAPDGPHEGVGFMPHHQTALDWDWQRECKRLGLVYIDPLASFEVTLNQISRLLCLLTEAMHGAIAADAFRVPWRALRISPYNYTGKWDDWASTVGVPVHFLPIPHLKKGANSGGLSFVKKIGKEVMGHRKQSSADEARLARRHLAEAAASDRWYLSDDQRLASALARFYEGCAPETSG
jgi:hypothetical protein